MASNTATIFDGRIKIEDPPWLLMRALKHVMTSLAKLAYNVNKVMSILRLQGYIRAAKKAKTNPTKTYLRRRHRGEAYR